MFISVYICLYLFICVCMRAFTVHIPYHCVSERYLSLYELGGTADGQCRWILADTHWYIRYSRIWADMCRTTVGEDVLKSMEVILTDTYTIKRFKQTSFNSVPQKNVNMTWKYVKISSISCWNPFKSCQYTFICLNKPLLRGIELKNIHRFKHDLNVYSQIFTIFTDMCMWIYVSILTDYIIKYGYICKQCPSLLTFCRYPCISVYMHPYLCISVHIKHYPTRNMWQQTKSLRAGR